MTKTIFFFIALLSCATACKNDRQKQDATTSDTLATKTILRSNNEESQLGITEIICDTVFKKPGYKVTLVTFDSTNENESTPNTLFTFSKLTNGHYQKLFSDSIYSKVQKAEFSDFNGDNVKDILIQNFSDARSNWTYYLYLIDTAHDRLKKINGFEEIKNPNYLSKYDIIDNMVTSGTNWTSFCKIQGDSIKDFDIVIYDEEDKNGKSTYDRDYEKAIKRILRMEKNSR